MPERLRGSDYRFLAVCLILLAVTAWFSVRYFHRAFPEAAIEFRVNREDSRALVERFLVARGLAPGDYRHASRFSYDGRAKTFLEREVGLERAGALLGSHIRLWRWSHRWFRPQRKEEFRVEITPRGEMAGFRHDIDEAAARRSLEMGPARQLAEEFLRGLGRDVAGLEFVEGASTARPQRTDYVFTWKERGFDVRDATYRFEVRVLGDAVGGYKEYLKVPEKWTRDYETLRSRNEMAQTVDTALLLLLVVGLLAAIVARVRRRGIRWRRAAVVGIVGAGLLFLANWNAFPLSEFGYPTTDSYASFIFQQLLNNVLAALAAGGLLFVLAAGAEPLYRESYGTRISLANLLAPRGIRTRSFLRGAVLGLALAGVFVAYQIAFYMVAVRLGAWSPAEVPYDEMLNTRFPWLFVLFGGYLPAVSEEFLFRMFAIPYLKKIFRATWVAVIVAGFLWGFGHAAYPQQPFWIRGVEVGLGGVALGYIMLRWGILPCLVWHYSVDAMYTALLLMRSPSLYFKASGAASACLMVLPVAIALVLYWRRGGFAPEEGLTNADETPVAAAPSEESAEDSPAAAPEADYRPLSRPVAWGAAAIFAVAMLFQFVPVEEFGVKPRYAIDERQARTVADRFLRERALTPETFKSVTLATGDFQNLAAKYFLLRKPVGYVSGMFERYRPVRAWRVRYFKPLEREDIEVTVHPETGQAFEFRHTLPEERPGAKLTIEEARGVAARFASARGWDMGRMDLKESSSEDKKARRDHRFEWEARAGDERNLDEAHYRLRVYVEGDRVSELQAYWKTPEAFQRERSQRNAVSMTLLALRIAGIATLMVVGIWLLVAGTRQGAFRWRDALRVAAPVSAAAVVALALGYKLMYRGYNTAIPWPTFQAMLVIGMVMGAIGIFIMVTAAVALLLYLRPHALAALRPAARAAAASDALLAAGLAIGLPALVAQARALAHGWFPAQALLAAPGGELLSSPAPAVSVLSSAPQSAVTLLAAAALVAYALTRMTRRRWLAWVLAALAVVAMTPMGVHTPGEFAVEFSLTALEAALAAGFLWFLRGNTLACVLAALVLSVRSGALVLLAQPNTGVAVQGYAAVAALVLVVAWAVAPAWRQRRAANQGE
jgi:membrane protease YdiL (CAAX protease family)